MVLAEVRQVRARRTRNGRSIVELKVHDGTGGMAVVFFNQPWRSKQLAVGSQALFFGKLDDYRGGRQMTNPVVDLVVGVEGRDGAHDRTGRVVPVYPASAKAGLSSWELGTWVTEALTEPARWPTRSLLGGVLGSRSRIGRWPSGPSIFQSRWTTCDRRAVVAWPSTSSSGCNWPSSSAAGPSNAPRGDPPRRLTARADRSATRRTAHARRGAGGATAVRADRSATQGSRSDVR